MTEYRIRCRISDNQGIIQSVGIGKEQFTVEQIWKWINSNTHDFFTLENGHRAEVRHGTSVAENHYITTAPDSITENNLDELDECT